MRWRRLLVVLHRDIGFFCVGLIVVYAVSGIAVNHRHHWDYNYSRSIERQQVGSPADLLGVVPDARSKGQLARDEQQRLVERLVTLSGGDRPAKVFWRGPDRLSLLFGEGGRHMVDYLPSKGVVEVTRVAQRPLIRQFNFLHLNEGRRYWTYVADLFAVLLVFLAVSGPLIVRGRRGLRGRGGVLVAVGVLVPLLAYLLLRH